MRNRTSVADNEFTVMLFLRIISEITDTTFCRTLFHFRVLGEKRLCILYLARNNFLVDLNWLIGKERRIAGGHFVDEHAERPPIDGLVVALKIRVEVLSMAEVTACLAEDYFRREVLGSAAQCPCPAFHPFRKTEIRNLKLPAFNNTHVDHMAGRNLTCLLAVNFFLWHMAWMRFKICDVIG
jgi:hypothetical protein